MRKCRRCDVEMTSGIDSKDAHRDDIWGATIQSNGRTVLVTDVEGLCVGRFSFFGIEANGEMLAQMRGESQCSPCPPENPTAEDWRRFQALMGFYGGVMVSDRHRPQFLAPLKQAERKDVEDANLS